MFKEVRAVSVFDNTQCRQDVSVLRKNRILSWIVLLGFCFVILGSSFFIVSHADHDCTGSSCSVCMELSACSRTISSLGTAVTVSLPLITLLCTAAVFTYTVMRARTAHTTLISLKVELLD